MPKDPKLYDALNTQLGREQYCPKCGGHNPSGKNLPEECVWCNRCNMIAELPKADLSKGWNTPQVDILARLRQQNVELVDALKEGLAIMDKQCAEIGPIFETCDFCDQLCEVYVWKQKINSILTNSNLKDEISHRSTTEEEAEIINNFIRNKSKDIK